MKRAICVALLFTLIFPVTVMAKDKLIMGAHPYKSPQDLFKIFNPSPSTYPSRSACR